VHTHPETDDGVSQDYSRWEWYTVTEILEGPLRNPTHLSTALQTKFIKRILSFLRPSNLLFSAQSWTVVRPPSPLSSLRSFSLFSFALCWCLRRASLGGIKADLFFCGRRQPNMKYVRVACLLLEVLLAESEGYKYLEEKNPLVFQIADLLRVEVEGVTHRPT
jgi:rapamycin-insensitive companion of mTOR